MKKFTIAVCAAIFLLSFTLSFAQSRKVTPTSTSSGKVNKRPDPTPTPVVENVSVSETEVERESAETVVVDGEVLKVETEVVNIPVKISDKKGRFISGLTKENFKVFEDGVEQQIEYFSNEQQPFTVALILDMSYSAKFKATEIQVAAMSFINQLRPKDKVMVVSFDAEMHIHCEPTSDRKVLERAIKSTKIEFGTSLYDTLNFVINKKMKNIGGRKAIVLFSDGVDTTSESFNSGRNIDDLVESNILVYPIQYDTFNEVQSMKDKTINKPQSPIPSKNKSPFPFPMPTVGMASNKGTTAEEYRDADRYLNEMANRSGGRLYQASTIANLEDSFTKIAAELREYYSLGYTPSEASKNGKKHKIKVRVDQEGVIVRAKDDYVIGKKEEK